MRASYRHITIFECQEDFNFPLISSTSATMVATCEKGEMFVVVDDAVYVRHKESDKDKGWGAYGQAVIGRDFIELNEKIFHEVNYTPLNNETA